jgi:hypothetical protein
MFGVNELTGLVLFEVGTEGLDDYCPSFIHSWTPDGVSPHWLRAS